MTWINYFAPKHTILTQRFIKKLLFRWTQLPSIHSCVQTRALFSTYSEIKIFPSAHHCHLMRFKIWHRRTQAVDFYLLLSHQKGTEDPLECSFFMSDIFIDILLWFNFDEMMHLHILIWRLKKYIDWANGDTVFKGQIFIFIFHFFFCLLDSTNCLCK